MKPASVWLTLSLLFLHQALGKANKHEMLAHRPGAITKVTIETIQQPKIFDNREGYNKCNSRRMKRFRNQSGSNQCVCEPASKKKVYTRAEELEEELARREDDEEMEELEAEIEARERKESEEERRIQKVNRIQIRIK
ncbi:hypothetical protein TcWFU_007518 [Taenia crassiceps]|uniref:Secreted protein n=1 Tax=Taenia crassiceps TaxID=6207 RepID=A0ABR4QU03_9CEST